MSTLSLILASSLIGILGLFSFKVAADRAEEKRMRKIPVKIDKRRS